MVKPSKKKKKFIDKKHAVTFHLVHRSQKDPLVADEEAPQHVLLPSSSSKQKKQEERKAEERKFGIFFDDNYDYLQHVKDVNTVPTLEPVERIRIGRNELIQEEKIVLPSSVFASKVEEDVGLLNKAVSVKGPQPTWDPDIVAALDEDFDFSNPDNELEDDFIMLANGGQEQHKSETGEDSLSDQEDDDDDAYSNDSSDCDCFFDNQDLFMEEETKSQFTNYSMTSSVLPRNDGLKFLDDKFEKMFEQYNNEEIGALEGEEIEGYIQPNSAILDKTVKDFEIEQQKITIQNSDKEKDSDMLIFDEADDLVEIVVEESQEKWDCESILSNYSSLYNHPKLIKEPPKMKTSGIQISQKLGIPLNTLTNRKGGLTKELLSSLDKDNGIIDTAQSIGDKSVCRRPSNETPEEKRLRKKMIKEQQKERRAEKKANTKAFKEEKKRQEKVLLNLQQNMRGIKLI